MNPSVVLAYYASRAPALFERLGSLALLEVCAGVLVATAVLGTVLLGAECLSWPRADLSDPAAAGSCFLTGPPAAHQTPRAPQTSATGHAHEATVGTVSYCMVQVCFGSVMFHSKCQKPSAGSGRGLFLGCSGCKTGPWNSAEDAASYASCSNSPRSAVPEAAPLLSIGAALGHSG